MVGMLETVPFTTSEEFLGILNLSWNLVNISNRKQWFYSNIKDSWTDNILVVYYKIWTRRVFYPL